MNDFLAKLTEDARRSLAQAEDADNERRTLFFKGMVHACDVLASREANVLRSEEFQDDVKRCRLTEAEYGREHHFTLAAIMRTADAHGISNTLVSFAMDKEV